MINNEVMACNPRCNNFNVLCFFFLLIIFVMMLWSLMRCNQVWVYTYLREKNCLCLTRWRCCCCFGGEGEDLTLVQLPHWLTGHYQATFCPMGSRVGGQGLVRYGGTSLLFLQWQVRITVSPALLLSSLSFMCSQDFNCKEDKRKKATLYFESAIPPKIQDLFLYGLL